MVRLTKNSNFKINSKYLYFDTGNTEKNLDILNQDLRLIISLRLVGFSVKTWFVITMYLLFSVYGWNFWSFSVWQKVLVYNFWNFLYVVSKQV